MSTDTNTFHFHRSFELGADQMWHLLTDGAMREKWGAPSEGTVLIQTTADLRTGGIERHICGPREAPEFEVETRWYRLDAPHDAAFTETVEIGGSAIATSLVTYRLAPGAGGCELHVTVAVSSFCGPEAPQEFHQGWEGGLANLEALVARTLAN